MPIPQGATVTLGEQNDTIRPVTIQLRDSMRRALTSRGVFELLFSLDAAGVNPVNLNETNIQVSDGGAGALLDPTFDTRIGVLSSAAGVAQLDINNSAEGTPTLYLSLVLGNGVILPPVAIPFDAP